MISNEQPKYWFAGYVSADRVAQSAYSRQGIPKSETGKRSLLPVGKTSQQDSRSAVQLGHQRKLG